MNNVQWSGFLEGIPNLIVALLVLLIGWIIAKAIEKGVKKGLEKTDLDDKLFSGGKERRNDNKKWTSEKIISKVVYWIVLIFVFVIFFNILNLDIIAAPLSDMLSTLFAAIPNILVHSVYRWEGKVVEDGETLLLLKSTRDMLPELTAAVRELHSYSVPCVTAFDVVGGNADYIQWVADSVGPESRAAD